MFTGIVDHVGKIVSVHLSPKGMTLSIESQFTGLVLGESIAIDGICLTVVRFDGGQFTVELSPETLKLTLAEAYRAGTRVNLERALAVTDRFGGHIVSGHVEGWGRVRKISQIAEFTEIHFDEVGEEKASFLTPKGSITVNGVSLTVNEASSNGFTVMLIPHTLERTNLSLLKENDKVNLEYDFLTKVVVTEVRKLFKNLSQSSSL